MGKNVAVFVDVANIFYAAKAAGVDIDYVTLLKSATAGRDFVRAYAYTGLDPDNENQRNFHQFLARHQYKVVSKDIRKYGDGKVKANLDIELVVDMMKTARNLDVAVVVSGDGDFASAIRAVQEMGVRVEVISFRGNTSSDLIEAADQFTDITQIARVDKGSSRSGRRVAAGEDEDLSMTEVPEKQSEGTGRGRGRGGRGRTGGRSTERTWDRSGDRVERETPAAAAAPTGRGPVALPGERLSRAAMAASAETAEGTPDVDEVAEVGTEARVEGEDGEGRRRRRRRGGRGRGRGREREDGLEAGTPIAGEQLPDDDETDVEDDVENVAELDADVDAAPRSPRPRPFGSVWDSQLGTPAPRPAALAPLPEDDEEFDDEPEIPEYLLAERRRNAGGGARGGGRGGARGGARSAYAAAIERERYGGGRTGGVNRFAEPTSGGRGPSGGGGGSRRPSPVAPRGPRPDRDRQDRPAARTSSEPWSEVPPELEAMLLQQLKGGVPAPGGAPSRGGDAPAELRPERAEGDRTSRAPREPRAPREGREPMVAASVETTPFDALLGGATSSGPAEGEAAATTRRRTTRRTAAPAPDATADAETLTEAPAPDAEAAAPKRRTTRRTKAEATTEAVPAASTTTEAPAPDAEAAAPKRRTTRRTKAEATTEAAPAASTTTEAPAADAEAAAPKRRTTRRTKAEATGPTEG